MTHLRPTVHFTSAFCALLLAAGCGGTSPAGTNPNGYSVGHECKASSDCASNKCDSSLPGGTCVDACGSNNSCPNGATCGQPPSGSSMECLASCTRNADCRLGYVCDTTQSVCLPPMATSPNGCRATGCPSGQTCDTTTDKCINNMTTQPDAGTTQPMSLTNVGTACTQDSQCLGAAQPACITAANNFPGGYCSAVCTTNSDCGQNGTCTPGLFQDNNGNPISICLESCSSDASCRSGYFCNSGVCFPHDCRLVPSVCTSSEICNMTDGSCTMVTHTGPAPVTLSGCPSTGYSADVKFGSSPNVYHLDLDSGSSTTAVASNQCSNCTGVSPLYTPGNTAQDQGQPQQSQYADGTGWSGEIYTDTATIVGGPGSVQLAFVAISSQNSFFRTYDCQLNQSMTSPNNGIMGIGPDDLALQGTDDAITDVVTQRMVGDLFAVQMCNQGGSLWVGGFDTGAMSAAPQYTPILSMNQNNPYYSVTVSNMTFGTTSVGNSRSLGQAMVDTGTSLLVLPTSVYQALTSAITSNSAFSSTFSGMGSSLFSGMGGCVGGAVTPAQIDSMLPPLQLTFAGGSGGSFTLQAPATKSYLDTVDMGNGTYYYCAGVMDLGSEGQTIMGDTLLKAFVTIFDIKNNRIGFAPSQGCP